MTEFASPPTPFESSLPPLEGGLVWLYRGVWTFLSIAAVGALVWSAIQPGAEIAISGLRLLKCGVVITVTAILLRRRSRDPVAAVLSLALLVWAITSSVNFSSSSLILQLLDRLRFLLFALALLLFPDGIWRPHWAKLVAFLSAFTFGVGALEASGVLSTHLYWPVAIGCVLAAIVAMVEQYKVARGDAQRQQLKWVALGLAVGVGLILTARAGAALAATSPAMASMAILWEGLFQLGIVVIACGFLVSLLRYRLYDAESAISRSTTLAGLTIVLVAIFAATEAAVEGVGQLYFSTGVGTVSSTMAAAVVAVLLSPLHERISAWTERRFQRDLVALKDDLPEVLDILTPGADPRTLAAAVLQRINRAVHAECSALAVGGELVAAHGISVAAASRAMSRPLSGAEGHFPIVMTLAGPTENSVAALLLGRRPDGSAVGTEDLKAIESVWPHIRRSLAQAMAWERQAARTKRELQSFRRTIEAFRLALDLPALEA